MDNLQLETEITVQSTPTAENQANNLLSVTSKLHNDILYFPTVHVSHLGFFFSMLPQAPRERQDFKRHDSLLRVPRITELEGTRGTGCPLASCSPVTRGFLQPRLTPSILIETQEKD